MSDIGHNSGATPVLDRVAEPQALRDLTPEEISRFETQRGFGVVVVRDGSPAYNANILPGDIIIQVNGVPADIPNWKAAMKSGPNLAVKLFRNGELREVTIPVPADWRPK